MNDADRHIVSGQVYLGMRANNSIRAKYLSQPDLADYETLSGQKAGSEQMCRGRNIYLLFLRKKNMIFLRKRKILFSRNCLRKDMLSDYVTIVPVFACLMLVSLKKMTSSFAKQDRLLERRFSSHVTSHSHNHWP